MSLNIKNPLVERMARELAAATGETLTLAARKAVEERLHHVRRGRSRLKETLLEIGAHCAGLPEREGCEPIYDQHGLPR